MNSTVVCVMNKAVRFALALIANSVLCCCIFENCLFSALVDVFSFLWTFFCFNRYIGLILTITIVSVFNVRNLL